MHPRRDHPPPGCVLIPELFVDDAFEGFVMPEVLQIAYEPLDIAARTILAGAGRVRGHHDIVHIPQRAVWRQGLPGRHVECSTVNLLVLECPDQVIFDDDLTARDADEQGTRLHLGKGFGVEQSLCLLCEWATDRDYIRGCQEFGEKCWTLDLGYFRGVGDGIAVNRLAVHAKGVGPSRHGATRATKADDPHSQPAELDHLAP